MREDGSVNHDAESDFKNLINALDAEDAAVRTSIFFRAEQRYNDMTGVSYDSCDRPS
jgi:hypothetical protein